MQGGIFISYSHKDSQIVEQIVKIMKDVTNEEIWFDYRLRGGENFFSVIAQQILENQYFIFMVSKNSVQSEWCIRELQFAASERRRIIAVWLADTELPPEIKLVIHNTHYLNWHGVSTAVFRRSLARTFDATLESTWTRQADRALEELLSKKHRYFLDIEERKKLTELLRAEQDGQYSLCFQPENANLLGIAYELGFTVEADEKKAALYYKTSKYYGDPDGQFLYAALLHRTQEAKAEYLDEMLHAAERGGIRAMTAVGDFYYDGKHGISKDQQKAFAYYERAAKAGGAFAMYATAFEYSRGTIIPQDLELAYMYALQAMERDHAGGYRLLGMLYQDGNYVSQDSRQAVHFFMEAIKRGSYTCYTSLAFTYEQMGETDKALEHYHQAMERAESGEIQSGLPFYNWALVLCKGQGVQQDPEAAITYYFKAAERNNQSALEWTVPNIMNLDANRRQEYLLRALELKCQGAAYELGKIERDKRQSDQKKLSETAVRYFEIGAEDGDIYCVIELIYNYSFILGHGENDDDRTNALKWFRYFFANAGEEVLNQLREQNLLTSYYYAYAMELDYDSFHNQPDREFVLYYLQKSVEESPMHLGRIIGFTVDGYLFPEKSGSGLKVDIPHAEEILAFASKHLQQYLEYLVEHDPEHFTDEWEETMDLLIKGYQFIAKCYKTGKHVKKNKSKAEKYQSMAKLAAVEKFEALPLLSNMIEQLLNEAEDLLSSC